MKNLYKKTKSSTRRWQAKYVVTSDLDSDLLKTVHLSEVLMFRVYKRGSSVRVDTTLLGFDQHSWVRGSRSYIFTGTESGVAKFTEIDHDTKQVYTEEMGVDPDLGSFKFSSAEQVQHRLSTPLIQTFLDTENISFQRSKSGLFG